MVLVLCLVLKDKSNAYIMQSPVDFRGFFLFFICPFPKVLERYLDVSWALVGLCLGVSWALVGR